MGLLDQMKEDKEKLAAMIDGGIEEEIEDEIIVEDEPEEKEADEEVNEPTATEESDEPKEEEPKLDNAEYARLRREKKAMQRQLEQAQQNVQQPAQVAEQPIVAQAQADPEPDRANQYPQWMEWKIRQNEDKIAKFEKAQQETEVKQKQREIEQSAIQEFQSFEADFKAIEPSYDDAAEFYTKQLGNSFKLLHPNATPNQIGDAIRSHVLYKAAQYYNAGLDPAEELFAEAQNLGFTKKESKKETAKPDMNKVLENRSRNSGMAATSGVEKKKTNLQSAASMTTGEWAKLTKAEKDIILKGR